MNLLKTFGKNETKRKNETKNVSPGRPSTGSGCDLEVGREYLIRAPGMCALGTYTGMASPPGDPSTGSGRERPRFWPVTWIRGAPDDPAWPIYAGPRATWKPVAAFGTATGHLARPAQEQP